MKLSETLAWLVGALLMPSLMSCQGRPPAHAPRASASASAAEPEASSDRDVAAVRELLDRGKALAHAGKPSQAETPLQLAFQSASALTPANPSLLSEVLAELASCLVQLNRSAEAQPLIHEALPLVPHDTLDGAKREFQLQMILAESYRYEKRDEFAVAPFRAALAVTTRPQFEADMVKQCTDASTRLARTLDGLDRHAEASETLEQALQVAQRHAQAGDSYRLSVLLAVSQIQLGKLGQALTLLQSIGAKGRGLHRSDMTYYDVPLEEFMAAPAAPQGPPAPVAHVAPMPPPQPTHAPGVPNAALRVAEMREAFQRCYLAALSADPRVEGSTRVVIKVGADGSVTESKALGVGVPVEMVECILRRAVSSSFDPPDGGSAVIVVPVSFVKR
jgi:tetratricopeptide (TPR) repeat protein